jgi:hypothetical protein
MRARSSRQNSATIAVIQRVYVAVDVERTKTTALVVPQRLFGTYLYIATKPQYTSRQLSKAACSSCDAGLLQVQAVEFC